MKISSTITSWLFEFKFNSQIKSISVLVDKFNKNECLIIASSLFMFMIYLTLIVIKTIIDYALDLKILV